MSTVLCLGGLGLRHSRGERLKKPSTGKVILVGRKILQVAFLAAMATVYGARSGVMAAILGSGKCECVSISKKGWKQWDRELPRLGNGGHLYGGEAPPDLSECKRQSHGGHLSFIIY